MTKNITTISSKVTRGEELVVIPRSLYEKFSRWEKELGDAIAKVQRGRRAYKAGKTYVVSSPKELLDR
ncbi:MAG: hypothetical protein ABIH92_01105 [Nanoarchaeota archaeon]